MKTKQRPKNVTPRPYWLLNEKTAPPIVALGAMLGVILLTLLFNSIIKPKNSPDQTNNKVSTAVTLTTSDGIKIAADLDYPSGTGPWPVVILLHEFGQDRSQWKTYREFFISEGFAVLRYDTRGFGESSLAAIPTAQSSWFASMPNDLAAAVKYAAAQKKIDSGKIFVIGAGLGANIAYVGSGTLAEIDKTALLSPTINPQLDGSTTDNFFPQHILTVANTAEELAVKMLMDRVTDLESQSVILDDPTAKGLGILNDQTARQRIVDWLNL